jgi:hypothetical protein
MRAVGVMLVAMQISFSANAQSRSSSATATPRAIVLPAGSCISSGFGPRILADRPQAGTFHNGVDLPAPEGTPVRAVAAGSCCALIAAALEVWRCWFSTTAMSVCIAIWPQSHLYSVKVSSWLAMKSGQSAIPA